MDSKADEKPDSAPAVTERNALGLDDGEIARGLEILAESNREWDRIQAEKGARGEPGPADEPDDPPAAWPGRPG